MQIDNEGFSCDELGKTAVGSREETSIGGRSENRSTEVNLYLKGGSDFYTIAAMATEGGYAKDRSKRWNKSAKKSRRSVTLCQQL